ncbi:helix-hairpin-helix domain-containing protein [Sphingobacterium sp.]|uniref:helix-hairpin-helix domain-containing protein n=1 Tax=Sphingobacterium sp. TaxID=341027 RepID=UPI0028ACCC60|nr:helix-hairpin-helix domain-containing protein [Sphingobacterium sp.]
MRKLAEYFQLSQKEQRGMLFLICILFLLFLAHIFLPIFYPKKEITLRIEHFHVTERAEPQYEEGSYVEKGPVLRKKPKTELFLFDPNTLDKAGWQRLGLSSKQAQVIINYRNKGGTFYDREDLRKIYSLSDEKVEEILPFVRMPELKRREYKEKFPRYDRKEFAKKENRILEVNSSDSLAFMELRGIGPAFSRRIVRFREALGGYVKLEQLAEVYGLPEETYQNILPYLRIDTSLVKRLSINHISQNDLGKHPYVKYKRAQTIINYRKQHGAFKSMEDLRNVHSLDEEFFRKIELYLDFR